MVLTTDLGEAVRLGRAWMRKERMLTQIAHVAVTDQGGNTLAVQLAEFAQMPEEQRRVRLADLAASVNRRLRAVDGSDDEDDQTADVGSGKK
ncbi:hypothetical protein [Streptomyces halstedii]|uniref:hypothetical protein n=1 Tax=Streptomyces halstedii TaxID=1944 RepID=UPI001941555F|nr:hypothetical protein [Streptomyces halstedii]